MVSFTQILLILSAIALFFYHNTSQPTSMSAPFFKAVEERRSVYVLTKESTIPDEKITEIVQNAVKHCPSTFNIQSGRAVVLFGEKADKVWDTLSAKVETFGPEMVANLGPKISLFKNSYATILFFEDSVPITTISEKMPAYKDAFPKFSDHSTGMIQFTVWTALAAEGMGATLQHFGGMIDAEVKEIYGIPATWTPVAMMPTGKPATESGVRPKTFEPIEDRVKVFA